MAARKDLPDRKIPYKPRGPYKSKGVKRGPNPSSWVSGPDPRRHDQYTAWLKHKSQAAYRGEPHEISFEQWEAIWNEDWAWENRGRDNMSVNLTRLDREKGWTTDNVHIITRVQNLRSLGSERLGKTFKRGKK